jgi:hypothetical protein
MPIREVSDAIGAERYIRDQLIQGTTLAQLVLNQIDFSRGKVRIAMPANIDQTPPFNFKSGNTRLDGDEEMALARIVKSFIGDAKCSVLMQETQLEKTDRFFAERGYENLVVSYKEEVYWAVAGRELATIADDEMLTLVRSASAYPFSAFFCVSVTPLLKTLVDDDLKRVVTELVGIAVDAVDGGSFLLWWRDEITAFPTVTTRD